jgi:hypothetical protein
VVRPAAWKRVCGEKKWELAQLVEKGALVGRKKGRRLTIQAGSFYDWLKEPVPVFPDWGFRFEVLPDGMAAKVRQLRQARQSAKEAMEHAPLGLGLELASRDLGVQRKRSSAGANEIAEELATHLRKGVQLRWRELLAVEQVLEEIAAEFDGEVPVRPQDRQAISEGKEQLKELHEQVQKYVGPCEHPGPDEEELEQWREAVRRAGEG